MGYYFYCTWLSGLETTVVDTNQLPLSVLNENVKIYHDLVSQTLISPFKDHNMTPKFIILTDQLPELKRFEALELHSYSGILINIIFSYMTATTIQLMVSRLKALLATHGFIIVNEIDLNKETYSDILHVITTKNIPILKNNMRKNLNTETSSSPLSSLVENVFVTMGFKILLRTKHFDNIPYIGWLFRSE